MQRWYLETAQRLMASLPQTDLKGANNKEQPCIHKARQLDKCFDGGKGLPSHCFAYVQISGYKADMSTGPMEKDYSGNKIFSGLRKMYS